MKEIKEDLLQNRNNTLMQKLWAYRRGFLSSRINMYGLNDKNYMDFLSDFDYLNMQPINGQYNLWIDDKLTFKYLLHPFDEFLPSYYYQLKRPGTIIRLMDCPEIYGREIDDILSLLKFQGAVAAKPISGTRGAGFLKIAHCRGEYSINKIPVSKNEIIDFIKELDDYIITEYLTCHKDIGRIWGETPNTLRVITINENNADPKISHSYIRFGTSASGLVDNTHAGGIAALIDINSGIFFGGITQIKNKIVPCSIHPDTKTQIEGTIPYWEQMKEQVISICNYLPQLKIMGFDLIACDDGFKIIEINSRPAITELNYFCPIYKNDDCNHFFKKQLTGLNK